MVDSGTVCSVVCLLGTLTLCGSLLGLGQDIFPTCSRRLDYQIELQLAMVAALGVGLATAAFAATGRSLKQGTDIEAVLIVCATLSVFCIAVESLIQFIMLLGFNDHCQTKMTTIGMVLLWIYLILCSMFALPILMYSTVMLCAIGPLIYFEYKRSKQFRYHKNRAQWMLGKEEGWDSFHTLITPQYLYRSSFIMITYCIYYCSWEISLDEAFRCAALGMRCPGCSEYYSSGEYIFVSPITFHHAHTECIEANNQLLNQTENEHLSTFWHNLMTKMNEMYPREFRPSAVERFFEPEGLFKLALNPQGAGAQDVPDEEIPPELGMVPEDLLEEDSDSS